MDILAFLILAILILAILIVAFAFPHRYFMRNAASAQIQCCGLWLQFGAVIFGVAPRWFMMNRRNQPAWSRWLHFGLGIWQPIAGCNMRPVFSLEVGPFRCAYMTRGEVVPGHYREDEVGLRFRRIRVRRPFVLSGRSAPSLVLLLIGLAALSGCAANSATTAVTPIVTTASADVAKAETVYGIAKGIAQVAALSNPSLAPTITATIAKLDPYAAALQSGAPTLAGIAVSAAGLVDQAAALEASTAQAVKVVPAS